MRTLTLGILIVSGGTLAALPFRRYQAIPDSSTTPIHATGPTISALQMDANSSISQAIFSPPQMSEAMLPGSILAPHSETPGVAGTKQRQESSSNRVTSMARTPPSHGSPLTYEDLVLPIEMPDIVQQRFNATAAVKSIQMERERVAKTDKSKMEPMTTTSSDTPNSADTSLLALPSLNEMASRSILKPRVNQSPSRQASDEQQPRKPTSGPKSNEPARGLNTAIMNRANRQMPARPEPTLAAQTPAVNETTAGSLASTSATRNTSAKQLVAANGVDPGTLLRTKSNRLLPKADSPLRARHWIQQPD